MSRVSCPQCLCPQCLRHGVRRHPLIRTPTRGVTSESRARSCRVPSRVSCHGPCHGPSCHGPLRRRPGSKCPAPQIRLRKRRPIVLPTMPSRLKRDPNWCSRPEVTVVMLDLVKNLRIGVNPDCSWARRVGQGNGYLVGRRVRANIPLRLDGVLGKIAVSAGPPRTYARWSHPT